MRKLKQGDEVIVNTGKDRGRTGTVLKVLPDDRVLGEVGQGWAQVTAELAHERSGPDRFLSDYRLFCGMVDRLGAGPEDGAAERIGGEQLVQPRVELGVLEVVTRHQHEEAAQREDRLEAAARVAVGEQVAVA